MALFWQMILAGITHTNTLAGFTNLKWENLNVIAHLMQEFSK